MCIGFTASAADNQGSSNYMGTPKEDINMNVLIKFSTVVWLLMYCHSYKQAPQLLYFHQLSMHTRTVMSFMLLL